MNYKNAIWVAAVVLAGLASACAGLGTSHESLTESRLTNIEKQADLLAKIRDVSSAQAAAEPLQRLIDEGNAIDERWAKLGDPTPEQANALEAKFSDRLDKITRRMEREMQRINANREWARQLPEIGK